MQILDTRMSLRDFPRAPYGIVNIFFGLDPAVDTYWAWASLDSDSNSRKLLAVGLG